jgi:hypothetical protein
MRKKKQVVIAHRGTIFTDLLEAHPSIKADVEGIINNKIIPHQKLAYNLTKSAKDFAIDNGYYLSITGHSLRAWLAELSALYAYEQMNYSKSKTVTFESPGSKPAFDSFKPNVQSKDTLFEAANFDITTYLSEPNFINCCNGHVGRVYKIEIEKLP